MWSEIRLNSILIVFLYKFILRLYLSNKYPPNTNKHDSYYGGDAADFNSLLTSSGGIVSEICSVF